MKFASFALLTFALQWQHAFSSVDNEGRKALKSSPRDRTNSYRVRNDNPLINHPMPPNPEPYQVTYDDGTVSPLLRLRLGGDETDPLHQIWEETLDGFTVAPSGGKYVYLMNDDVSGELIETDLVVGVDDPYASRIQKGAASKTKAAFVYDGKTSSEEEYDHVEYEITEDNLRKRKLEMERAKKQQQQDHRRTVITSGTLKNLVIPFKFSDHTSRPLPSRSALDTLMNNVGPDSNFCPTGSVRDLYLENSFDELELESTVIDWVTLDYTQAQCAGGSSGLFTGFHSCLTNALDKAVAAGVDFSDYDLDNDGYIDGITFFHSGYAAEFGGIDQYGTGTSGRIWSHKWAIYTTNWSNNGVRVYEYHINPSVWSTSGSNIGRIGVVAHETGHFLGLPDLYDYGDGSGIGSWGLMANSWGFDGSQYHPPHMSAWSKNVLGWVTPTVVSSSGTYSLQQACDHADMIRIDRGYPSGQYLLIENRQPCGFETPMPQGGLAIFYIDDNANNVLGYYGQSGWPDNGDHYKVALLQADGNYNLERNRNRGDSTDLFHAGGVNSIGPDGTSAGDPYPNTKPYLSSAHIEDLTISNISGAGSTMSFNIAFGSGITPAPVPITPAPTAAPVPITPAPTRAPSLASCGDGICQVEEGEGCGLCPADCTSPSSCNMVSNGSSSLVYSNSAYGVAFDVTIGISKLYFYGLKLYLLQDTTAKVYMKSGSYSTDSDLNNWTKVFDGSISSSGSRQEIEFQSRFQADPLSTVAFYVSFGSGGAFVYSRDGFSNDDATVLIGNTLTEQTGNTLPSTSFSNRAFYEGIKYDYGSSGTSTPTAPSTNSPTVSPTASPTTSPTVSPTKSKSTPAPVASTPAPVGSPTSSCSCCEELRSQMDNMENMIDAILDMMLQGSTLSPVASTTAAPTSAPTLNCTDRTDKWVINGINRKWCKWASNSNTATRCEDKNLFDDCPQICSKPGCPA